MTKSQTGGFWPFGQAVSTSGTSSYGMSGMPGMSGIPGFGLMNPFGSGTSYGYSGTSGTSGSSNITSGILQYLFYLVILIIVAMLLLIIINFTVYPIFKIRPGDKGFIPLPGSNDAIVYWENINRIDTIPDTDLGTMVENWSMMLDIQLDNPTSKSQLPRVLFTRGSVPTSLPKTYTANDTILNMNPAFNVIIYLDPVINDLYISIQTTSTDGNSSTMLQSAVIPNIPVGASIRLGLMIGSRSFEVYVNGYLVKTKTFSSSITPSVGGSSLQPPSSEIQTTAARVSNLRLWRRPLSSSEFRAYQSAVKFPVIAPLSDSCLSNPSIPTDLGGEWTSTQESAKNLYNNSLSLLGSYADNMLNNSTRATTQPTPETVPSIVGPSSR